jgi:hypothetical protein
MLHFHKTNEIFIFLIGYIYVNKGVFCLIISYLRIKSYNVMNYNNCSTDWNFPLSSFGSLLTRSGLPDIVAAEPFWLCFNIRSTAIQCYQFAYLPNFVLNIPIPCYIFIKQMSLLVFLGGGGGRGYLRIIPCMFYMIDVG